MLTKYLLILPTWNVGMVERISIMMEERRNRELTMTNTLAAEDELGSSKSVQMTLRSRAQQSPSKWSIWEEICYESFQHRTESLLGHRYQHRGPLRAAATKLSWNEYFIIIFQCESLLVHHNHNFNKGVGLTTDDRTRSMYIYYWNTKYLDWAMRKFCISPGECRHSRAPDREHWGPSIPAHRQSPWDKHSQSGGARPYGRGPGCSRRPAVICRNKTLGWPNRRSHRERGSPLYEEKKCWDVYNDNNEISYPQWLHIWAFEVCYWEIYQWCPISLDGSSRPHWESQYFHWGWADLCLNLENIL